MTYDELLLSLGRDDQKFIEERYSEIKNDFEKQPDYTIGYHKGRIDTWTATVEFMNSLVKKLDELPELNDYQKGLYDGNQKHCQIFSKEIFYTETALLKLLQEDDEENKEIDELKKSGFNLCAEKKFKKAVTCFNKALKINPLDDKALAGKGSALYCQGKFEEALKFSNKALKINQENIIAWSTKGMALECKDDSREALLCFDKVLVLDPEAKGINWLKTVALVKLKEYEKALLYINKALEEDPENGTHLELKMSILANLGRYKEVAEYSSKKILEENQSIETDDINILCKKGDALTFYKKYDEALVYFDKALSLEPDNYEALCSKGSMLIVKGDPEEALNYADRALKIESDHMYAWHVKGRALLELDEYEEALMCFDKYLDLDPLEKGSLHIYRLKGIALGNLGRFEEANECFDKALEIDPGNESIIKMKMSALKEMGKLDAFMHAVTTFGDQVDTISDAEGRFGYDRTNPVPVYMDKGQREYISKLLCPCSVLFDFERAGNVGQGVDGHIVDEYKLICKNKKHNITLYMDMYHHGPSSNIPEGLSTIETIEGSDRVRGFLRSGDSIVIRPDITRNIGGAGNEKQQAVGRYILVILNIHAIGQDLRKGWIGDDKDKISYETGLTVLLGRFHSVNTIEGILPEYLAEEAFDDYGFDMLLQMIIKHRGNINSITGELKYMRTASDEEKLQWQEEIKPLDEYKELLMKLKSYKIIDDNLINEYISGRPDRKFFNKVMSVFNTEILKDKERRYPADEVIKYVDKDMADMEEYSLRLYKLNILKKIQKELFLWYLK